jgi:hypothetical protein
VPRLQLKTEVLVLLLEGVYLRASTSGRFSPGRLVDDIFADETSRQEVRGWIVRRRGSVPAGHDIFQVMNFTCRDQFFKSWIFEVMTFSSRKRHECGGSEEQHF